MFLVPRWLSPSLMLNNAQIQFNAHSLDSSKFFIGRNVGRVIQPCWETNWLKRVKNSLPVWMKLYWSLLMTAESWSQEPAFSGFARRDAVPQILLRCPKAEIPGCKDCRRQGWAIQASHWQLEGLFLLIISNVNSVLSSSFKIRKRGLGKYRKRHFGCQSRGGGELLWLRSKAYSCRHWMCWGLENCMILHLRLWTWQWP